MLYYQNYNLTDFSTTFPVYIVNIHVCVYMHVHVALCASGGERTALVRLPSSVHSIILIGFIRGLKSNTSSVCCLGVGVYVCVCLYVHTFS